MADSADTIGIIGGSGMLGRAIVHALLDRGGVTPEKLWISNTTASPSGFEAFPGITFTSDNARLCAACGTVLLCVPPAAAPNLSIDAADSLVISVMAGVTLERLRELSGSQRVVRAMSSPAAELGLAYSPWIAGDAVTAADRARVTALFEACGATDEISDEAHLDHFTAMTGPVPGFVALYARCMIDHAVGKGIEPGIADRAVRQLFFAAGAMLAHGEASAADHVKQMIDYAGTTAAGLEAMQASRLCDSISEGLDAAAARARSIG